MKALRIFGTASLVALHLATGLGAARAEVAPRAGPRDARIRYVTYHRDEVVVIEASYGASTMIKFAEDERIETLGAGDAMAWRIEPNRRGNTLFVKPIDRNTTANLNVLTNKRSYVFVLRAAFRPIAAQVFSVVFRYPDEEGDTPAMLAEARARAARPNLANLRAENVNSSYGYKGSSAVRPLVIFDDGTKTFFRFDPARTVPAIYAVDGERNEVLVNFRREGEFIVVDRVTHQWTLRNGDDFTCIFNLRVNNVNQPTGLEAHASQRVGGGPVRTVRTPNAISQ